MQKIGIFGGSFNPIHKGHIQIAKEAIKFLNLDKLIFVPCQKNPFKKDYEYADGFLRKEMIELVLEEKMEVSTFEIERKGISYSIDMIKYFRNIYKNDELFLLIGSDNLTKLPKWKDIDEISQISQIVVFKRDHNINKTNIKKYNCLLLNNQIYSESSSEFFKGNFNMVDKKVLNFIGYKKIYFEQILKNTLKEKRFLHSLHARDFAIQLAKTSKYEDVAKAGFAAMVHDIAKNLANDYPQKARKLIQQYEPKKVEIEDYKLHQEAGYVILKYIFNVEDDISHAVRIHTSLDFQMNQLDKIVYLADKLCQGRKYDGIQEVRKLTFENLEKGFKKVIEQTIKFNLNKDIVFNREQQEIYDYWLNEIEGD